MGDGCKIAVFDLDGTLYRGATFRKYLFFGVRTLLKRGEYASALLIFRRFALSKAGIISHRKMKYDNCILLDRVLTDSDISDFIDSLMPDVSTEVRGLCEALKSQGYKTLLSTASPAVYCIPFARRLGFDYCHATDMSDDFDTYIENRGQWKLIRLRALEAQCGEVADVVVTDHHDDLPLLQANRNGRNYLVSPSAKTQMIVKMAGVSAEEL